MPRSLHDLTESGVKRTASHPETFEHITIARRSGRAELPSGKAAEHELLHLFILCYIYIIIAMTVTASSSTTIPWLLLVFLASPQKVPVSRDGKVKRIAQIIHDADLGDKKFDRTEGLGLDKVLNGWEKQDLPDDELLQRGMDLIEGLYQSLV